MLGGSRDGDRPTDDGAQDRPRADHDGQAQQGGVWPRQRGDADADVSGYSQERKRPGEAEKRGRDDEVQCPRASNAKPTNAANDASVQSTDTNATPAPIPRPPATASFHGVDADITECPQELDPARLSASILARVASSAAYSASSTAQ